MQYINTVATEDSECHIWIPQHSTQEVTVSRIARTQLSVLPGCTPHTWNNLLKTDCLIIHTGYSSDKSNVISAKKYKYIGQKIS